VTKPFSTPELLARLRVALRRGRAVAGEPVDPVVDVGDVLVDVPHIRVTVDGEAVDPRRRSSRSSAAGRYPGRLLTHRTILQDVGARVRPRDAVPAVYASQLRKKLHDDPSAPRLITEQVSATARGSQRGALTRVLVYPMADDGDAKPAHNRRRDRARTRGQSTSWCRTRQRVEIHFLFFSFDARV